MTRKGRWTVVVQTLIISGVVISSAQISSGMTSVKPQEWSRSGRAGALHWRNQVGQPKDMASPAAALKKLENFFRDRARPHAGRELRLECPLPWGSVSTPS